MNEKHQHGECVRKYGFLVLSLFKIQLLKVTEHCRVYDAHRIDICAAVAHR